MASIRDLFQQERIGFTVYSPDCAQSRLWGNLDHAIQSATGFQVVYRQWIYHDYNSIVRFYTAGNEPEPPYQDPEEAARKYQNVPAEELKYGHLVVRLFLSGPSFLTMWHGERPIETLLALKGSTHPSEAASHTIRGRFWCDNGVANLMHVSDDYQEAERELKVVNTWSLLDREAAPLPLLDPIPPPTQYVPHSGISVACEVVNRLLLAMNRGEKLDFRLPESGDAKETHQILAQILGEATQRWPDSDVSSFIRAYLTGDMVALMAMFKSLPATPWEQFSLQCGAITRYKWNPPHNG